MRKGLKAALDEAGITAHVGSVGSFFHIVWTGEEVVDFATTATGDRVLARYFSLGMMNRGIFKLGHPNVSAVTTDDDVKAAIEAARETIDAMKPLIKERAPHLLEN